MIKMNGIVLFTETEKFKLNKSDGVQHVFHCSLLRKYVDNPRWEYEIFIFLNKVANQNVFNKFSY